jgi:hypothetical protein
MLMMMLLLLMMMMDPNSIRPLQVALSKSVMTRLERAQCIACQHIFAP